MNVELPKPPIAIHLNNDQLDLLMSLLRHDDFDGASTLLELIKNQ